MMGFFWVTYPYERTDRYVRARIDPIMGHSVEEGQTGAKSIDVNHFSPDHIAAFSERRLMSSRTTGWKECPSGFQR